MTGAVGRPAGPAVIYVRPPREHPDGPALVKAALPRVLTLISTVREEGADSVAAILDRCDTQDLYALVTVLAAMVPDDRPAAELLAWVTVPRVRNVARSAS